MEEWMKDERLKEIPAGKLEFLSRMQAIRQSAGSSRKELLQAMLPLIREAREKGFQFTAQEVSTVISVIRSHSNADENQKIDELLKKAGDFSS